MAKRFIGMLIAGLFALVLLFTSVGIAASSMVQIFKLLSLYKRSSKREDIPPADAGSGDVPGPVSLSTCKSSEASSQDPVWVQSAELSWSGAHRPGMGTGRGLGHPCQAHSWVRRRADRWEPRLQPRTETCDRTGTGPGPRRARAALWVGELWGWLAGPP